MVKNETKSHRKQDIVQVTTMTEESRVSCTSVTHTTVQRRQGSIYIIRDGESLVHLGLDPSYRVLLKKICSMILERTQNRGSETDAV